MSDILSGGVVDQSTSGPIPQNADDRNLDILEQQKIRQEQDAVGGTEFAPRPLPPPPIPEPVDLVPQLPDIPFFSFDVSRSGEEAAREAARQAVIDVLKNVTINGQGPTIEGSSISFDVAQSPPSASETFSFDFSNVAPQQNITSFLQPPSMAEQTEQANLLRNEFNRPPLPPPPSLDIPENPIPDPKMMEPIDSGREGLKPEEKKQEQQPSTDSAKEPITWSVAEREISASEIKEGARNSVTPTLGFGASSNFTDAQTIRSAVEESENRSKQLEASTALQEVPKSDNEKQKSGDFTDANKPLPPIVKFQVCIDGVVWDAYIPANLTPA